MDLLIINPRIMWFSAKSLISNGPLAVASYLHKKHFNIRVIDDNTMYKKYSVKDFINYINYHQVKIIGFSVSTLNAFNCYALAKELRKRFPEKIFIAGGLHSFDSSGEITGQDFDIIFKGEAELSVERFLKLTTDYPPPITRSLIADNTFISRLKEIPGIIIKAGSKIIDTGSVEFIQNLDELPFSNFDLVNLNDYIRSRYDFHAVTNQINFQRGCPYNCTFCKSEVISLKVRSNSAPYMVEQLEYRYKKFKINNFFITDSNFTIDKLRLKKFCSLMSSSVLCKKINIMIQGPVNIPLSDDEIKMLKDVGVTMFLIGVERFHDNTRKLMRKSGSGHEAVALIKKLHRHGIKSVVNILVNFPFETEEVLGKEAELIEQNLPYINFLYINYVSPMPGTQVYKNNLDSSFANSFAKWYLKKETVNYQPTYYDLAYLIEGPLALKLNLFRLPRNVVAKMRHFKEKYQRKGAWRLSRYPLVKAVIILDMFLGKVSYYIAKLSFHLEQLIFKPVKFFRLKGYKMFFNLFVAERR